MYQDVGTMAEVLAGALGGCALSGARVFFYGAGVVSADSGGKVRSALERVIPGCRVSTGSDLEAAAIALFGRNDGVASILGTGSNSGLWQGGRIVRNIPAGGFILGDEGSGAWLGRRLVSDFIKGLLPEELDSAFREEFPGLDYPTVVSNVYREPMPSRFLASFSPFLKRHEDSSYVDGLLRDGFRQFLTRNVLRYGAGIPVGVIGSVACAYAGILRDVAKEYSVDVTKVEASAGDGLVAYYSDFSDL